MKPNTFDDFESVDENISPLKKAGQFALGLGTRAIEGGLKLAELPSVVTQNIARSADKDLAPFINKASSQGLIHPQDLQAIQQRQQGNVDQLSDKFVRGVQNTFGKDSIEPENIVSKSLQDVAAFLPLTLLTGGASAAGLFQQLGGAVGSNLTEGLGLPVQIASSILTSKGFGKIGGLLKESLKNPASIDEFKKQLYQKSDKLGSSFKVSSQDFNKSADSLMEAVRKEPRTKYGWNSTDAKDALHNIAQTKQILNTPQVTGNQIEQANKYVNSFYSPRNKFYVKMNQLVKDQIDKASKIDPDWGKTFNQANKLHSIQNWQGGLTDFLENKLDNRYTQKILRTTIGQTATAILSGLPMAFDMSVAPTGKAVQFIKELGSSTQGQKVLWNIIADSANRSGPALAKSLHALDKMAEKWELENKDFESVDEFADFEPVDRFSDFEPV